MTDTRAQEWIPAALLESEPATAAREPEVELDPAGWAPAADAAPSATAALSTRGRRHFPRRAAGLLLALALVGGGAALAASGKLDRASDPAPTTAASETSATDDVTAALQAKDAAEGTMQAAVDRRARALRDARAAERRRSARAAQRRLNTRRLAAQRRRAASSPTTTAAAPQTSTGTTQQQSASTDTPSPPASQTPAKPQTNSKPKPTQGDSDPVGRRPPDPDEQ